MSDHSKPQYDARPTERLLTINDVADRLAISRDTVYRLMRSGALVPLRVGKRFRFRVSDVEAYLDREVVTSP